MTYSWRWIGAVGLVLAACGDDRGGSGDASATDGSDETTGSQEAGGEDTTGEPGQSAQCSVHMPDGESGSPLDWAFHCDSPASERLVGVAADAAGNVYAAFDYRGGFDGSVPVLMIGEDTIEHGGLSDIVLVALGPDGEVLWTRHFGGPGDQAALRLRGCGEHLVLAGVAEPGTLDLGDGPVEHDAWIASFDGQGDLRFARSFQPTTPDGSILVQDMSCDSDGRVAAIGALRDAADFGGGTIEAGPDSSFIVVLDESGEHVWSAGADLALAAVSFTPEGDAVATGSFRETIAVGGETLSTGGYELDGLVVRFGSTGDVLWARQFGGQGDQYPLGVAVASGGTIAIDGMFLPSLEIGDARYEMVPVDPTDDQDVRYDAFVATMDSSGSFLESRQIGSSTDDVVFGRAWLPSGELAVASLTADGASLSRSQGAAQETSSTSLSGLAALPLGELAPTLEGRVVVGATIDMAESGLSLHGVSLTSGGGGDVLILKLAP